MTIAIGKLTVGGWCLSVVVGTKVVTKLMPKAVITECTGLLGDRQSQSIAVGVGVGNATTTEVSN